MEKKAKLQVGLNFPRSLYFPRLVLGILVRRDSGTDTTKLLPISSHYLLVTGEKTKIKKRPEMDDSKKSVNKSCRQDQKVET